MDIFLIITGNVLTLIGAFTAIVGETWNPHVKGIKRLTMVGWTAAIVASLGISVSVYKSVDDHLTKQVYEDIALKDIRAGWRQVALPFFLLEWEATGKKGDTNVEALRKLIDSDLLVKFDEVDFTRMTKIPQYSKWDLGRLTCRQSSIGMEIMEGAVKANDERIARGIASNVQRLRQSSVFGRMLAAGCGSTVDRNPDYSLFKGMFSKPEMNEYIVMLAELGDALGDPGKKR